MNRVLITGGAGFLGSHLSERLLGGGSEVTCIDNFITGSRANVAHLVGRRGFRLVAHDIRQPFVLQRPPSIVFHLASPASPIAYLANPIDTLLTGSVGTETALELARAARATFVLASTSEVYGNPEVHPQPEWYRGSVSTTGPRSVYDEAKRYSEALTMAYHRARGVHTRIARIFNTYGPRLAPGDGRAIPNFIDQALSGRPLTVYGDGSQTRSFCYVDDTVEGLIALANRGGPEPVNLGNPDERTILDLARLIIKLTGSTSDVVFEDLPQDDPAVRRPDIAKARLDLGWEPKVSLEAGLAATVEWFRHASGPFMAGPLDRQPIGATGARFSSVRRGE
jgi:dTDP-glucose 4,6-dehydratase